MFTNVKMCTQSVCFLKRKLKHKMRIVKGVEALRDVKALKYVEAALPPSNHASVKAWRKPTLRRTTNSSGAAALLRRFHLRVSTSAW